MRLKSSRVAFSIVALLLIATVSQQIAPAQKKQKGQPATKTIILKVLKGELRDYAEPIVILDGGRYQPPPYAETEREPFNSAYFRPGQSYRLIYGGGDAGGTVVVEKPTERACQQWGAAAVKLQSTAGIKQALATNSNTLGKRKGTRRAPTDRERETALRFAREAFRRNRVRVSLLQTIKPRDIIATDLNHDGKTELIGHFDIVIGETDGVPDHSLLIILEPQGAGYRMTLSHYHHTTKKYNQTPDVQSEYYVDQLDLDGDGTDEIIVENNYWEASDYSIYKKQGGRWRRVYKGSDSGC